MENMGGEGGKRSVRNGSQRKGAELCKPGGEGQRLHVTLVRWLVGVFLMFVRAVNSSRLI